MNKKKKGYVLAIMTLTVLLTACTTSKDPLAKLSKNELIDTVNKQKADMEQKDVRIEELQTLLRGTTSGEGPSAAISTIDDGTGRLTFNSLDGKISFPKPFEYPGSTQTANTSSINITSTLKVIPTNNWAVQLNGSTLKLEHSSNISGMIKAGYIEGITDRSKMQEEVMAPFFDGLPPEKITYKKLFLDDQWWGMDAKTATTIDKEPAYLRCGMLGLGEGSFVYMFVYKGEQNSDKDEAILSLLRTIEMMGQKLRIE